MTSLKKNSGVFVSGLFFLLVLFSGCSKEPDRSELLVGTWRTKVKNIYTILSFSATGSWNANSRVEGKHSKIVEKRGNIKGEWLFEENRLEMTALEVDVDIGWEKGSTVYEVTTLNREELVVTEEGTGRVTVWGRVRGKSPAGSGSVEVGELEVGIGPLVVNLDKEREYRKDRFLCVDMGFVVDVSGEDLGEGGVYPIHPRIKDTVIMYLSSRIYGDVKNYDKIEKVRNELNQILNPYFGGKLRDLKIKHLVITANRQSMEDFILEYSVPPPKPESEENSENKKG